MPTSDSAPGPTGPARPDTLTSISTLPVAAPGTCHEAGRPRKTAGADPGQPVHGGEPVSENVGTDTQATAAEACRATGGARTVPTAHPDDTTPGQEDATQKAPASTTHVRNEFLLGPVHTVRLADRQHKNGRVVGVEYRLNVLDGWIQARERTDESGVLWQPETTVPSRVGTVLDAAPEHAEFVAAAHLRWIGALRRSGRVRRASQQRRALQDALRRHGLALTDKNRGD